MRDAAREFGRADMLMGSIPAVQISTIAEMFADATVQVPLMPDTVAQRSVAKGGAHGPASRPRATLPSAASCCQSRAAQRLGIQSRRPAPLLPP